MGFRSRGRAGVRGFRVRTADPTRFTEGPSVKPERDIRVVASRQVTLTDDQADQLTAARTRRDRTHWHLLTLACGHHVLRRRESARVRGHECPETS